MALRLGCKVHLEVDFLQGSQPMKFTIIPPLPNGMRLDEGNGDIAGSVRGGLLFTGNFQITATNQWGSSTSQVRRIVCFPASEHVNACLHSDAFMYCPGSPHHVSSCSCTCGHILELFDARQNSSAKHRLRTCMKMCGALAETCTAKKTLHTCRKMLRAPAALLRCGEMHCSRAERCVSHAEEDSSRTCTKMLGLNHNIFL